MGGEKDRYLMRYRGQIYLEDTAAAYDQLAVLLKPHHLSPLFRWDGERHAVLLVPEIIKPKPGSSRLNIILFIATVHQRVDHWGTGVSQPVCQRLGSPPCGELSCGRSALHHQLYRHSHRA